MIERAGGALNTCTLERILLLYIGTMRAFVCHCCKVTRLPLRFVFDCGRRKKGMSETARSALNAVLLHTGELQPGFMMVLTTSRPQVQTMMASKRALASKLNSRQRRLCLPLEGRRPGTMRHASAFELYCFKQEPGGATTLEQHSHLRKLLSDGPTGRPHKNKA